MCEHCVKGTGPCTCKINCGDPGCLCPPARRAVTASEWEAWNDLARWESGWDASPRA